MPHSCWLPIAALQEELAASGWDLGVPPVVAPRAHYGRPQDAPAQPTVFAGQEFRWGVRACRSRRPFRAGRQLTARLPESTGVAHSCCAWAAGARRVPTSAVEDLPEFQAGAAPRALQHLQQQQQPAQPWGLPQGPAGPPRGQRLLAYVPAKPPPSRAATDAWLAARRRRQRGRQQRGGGGEASFGMDPNTGKLLPAAAAADAEGRPGSAGAEGGTPSSLNLGDADLLATPSLCTLGSAGGSGQGTPGSGAATPPGTTAGTSGAAGGARRGQRDAVAIEGASEGSSSEEEQEEEVRG